MRKVVDSNFLQSPELAAYLEAGTQNVGVLPDYTAMEAYKGDTLASIFKSMSIVSRHPSQVLILKGTQEIGGLTETGIRMQKRMVDRDQTRNFPEYCKHLRSAQRGDPVLRAQILRLGTEASEHFDKLLHSAKDIVIPMQEVARNCTEPEVSLIRHRHSYTDELVQKILREIMLLAAHMLIRHPRVTDRPNSESLPYRFIFRFALCCVLWVLDWIADGSPLNKRADRTRNDMVDLQIVTYATYFDGILTADRKALRLYTEASVFFGSSIWAELAAGNLNSGGVVQAREH